MTVNSVISLYLSVSIATQYINGFLYIYLLEIYIKTFLIMSVFLLLQKIHYKNWSSNTDVSDHVCPIYPPRINI